MKISKYNWVLILVFFAPLEILGGEPYGAMKLLDGYSFRRSRSIDTINGKVFNGKGLIIEFESGTGAGYAADPAKRGRYISFREQVINGYKVYVALADAGASESWRPEQKRRGSKGRILLVTFPGNMSKLDAANFYAEVLNESEITDMLLMVLTFDPSK